MATNHIPSSTGRYEPPQLHELGELALTFGSLSGSTDGSGTGGDPSGGTDSSVS